MKMRKATTILWSILKITIFKADLRDKVLCALAVCLSLFSILLLTIAPVFVSKLIDDISAHGLAKWKTYFLAVGAFCAFRWAGSTFVDLRWIVLNPALYRITYAFCVHICKEIIASGSLLAKRTHEVADLSERIVMVEKAQLGAMGVSYQIIVGIIPLGFELMAVLIVSSIVLGLKAFAVFAVSAAMIAAGAMLFQSVEVKQFNEANLSDSRIFREVGQVISFEKLINEFQCFGVMQQKLQTSIARSLADHSGYFVIKSLRSAQRTVAIILSYVLVFFYVFQHNSIEPKSTPGLLFLMSAYLDRLVLPLSSVSSSFGGLRSSISSIRQVFDTLDKPSQDNNSLPLVEVSHAGIKLNLKVNSDSDLTEIELRPGDCVRISGKSGSGKSTFLAEICDAIRAQSSDKLVSYLQEKPLMIEGTVSENLQLGMPPTVSRQEVEQYMRQLQRNNGQIPLADLDQPVETVSSGERQVIAVMRSLPRIPFLLAIDEALNSLDTELEEIMTSYIRENTKTSIVFFISHREATALKPDYEIHFHATEIISVIKSGFRVGEEIRHA